MSRTYKDIPYKYSHPEHAPQYGEFYVEGTWKRLTIAGVFSKKKRHFTEVKWLSQTPMWWIHEFMNVPQRRKARAWEHKAVSMPVESLIDLDLPLNGRKPHLYYW